jgi:hypothetical protein
MGWEVVTEASRPAQAVIQAVNERQEKHPFRGLGLKCEQFAAQFGRKRLSSY